MPGYLVTILVLIAGSIGATLAAIVNGRSQTKVKSMELVSIEQIEVRKDLKDLRESIDKLQKDLDQWKQKYYILLEEYISLRQKYRSVLMLLEKNGLDITEFEIDLEADSLHHLKIVMEDNTK